jgi:hypothetical protein
VRIDETYTFDTPVGRRTLADLFDGRRQLPVQHFMLAPGGSSRGSRYGMSAAPIRFFRRISALSIPRSSAASSISRSQKNDPS